MKKILVVGGLIAVLVLGSAFAFADSETSVFNRNFRRGYNNAPFTELTEAEKETLIKEREEFRKENMEYRKEELKKALDNGEITQEEYNTWLEHFNYMDEFHNENGFSFGGGRGCHGVGMMRGFGRGNGMRRSPMGY